MADLITRHVHDSQFRLTSSNLASCTHDFIFQKELNVMISTTDYQMIGLGQVFELGLYRHASV